MSFKGILRIPYLKIVNIEKRAIHRRANQIIMITYGQSRIVIFQQLPFEIAFSGLDAAGRYRDENRSFLDQQWKKIEAHWHSFLFPRRDVDANRRVGVGLQVTILSTIRIVKAKNAVSPHTTFLYGMQLTRLECFPPRGGTSRVSRIYGGKKNNAIMSRASANWLRSKTPRTRVYSRR